MHAAGARSRKILSLWVSGGLEPSILFSSFGLAHARTPATSASPGIGTIESDVTLCCILPFSQQYDMLAYIRNPHCMATKHPYNYVQ